MTMKKSRVIEETLSKCRNIFGSPLSIRARSKIKAFLLEPTLQNWDSICGIVVWNSPVVNIWTVVVSQDPTLDIIGKNYEIKMQEKEMECPRFELVRDWEHIPSPMEVISAIRNFHNSNSPVDGEKVARKILNNVVQLRLM